MSNTGTIYLAGGCFWGVEELFRQLPGVVSTQVGYANGTGQDDASYTRVCQGDTGFRETVRVDFDRQVLPVHKLLRAYFSIIDPTIENRQGNDRGTQYQTGIYWEPGNTELADAIQRCTDDERRYVETRGMPFCVEVHELSNFFAAEEYHQKYLVKNPDGYCHVPRAEMAAVIRDLA